jgi:hypothetical protein
MFTSLAVVACVRMLFESGNTEPHQTGGLVSGSGGSCQNLIHHTGDVSKRLDNCQRLFQERVAVKDVGEKIGERKSKSAASLMIPNT